MGFFTETEGAAYTVSVYSTYSGGTLSGLLASTTASETYAGYHTVDLPSLVSLTAGSKFYVCLYLPGGGLAADGVCTFRDSSGDITLSDSACTASPGESYYSSNVTPVGRISKLGPNSQLLHQRVDGALSRPPR